MTPKRPRGRPRREGAEAGRDAVVIAARRLLRRRPRIDLNRKELAIEAGVTPALVNYYFRDQPGLIEAAARPVLDAYLQRLRSLVREDRRLHEKFRAVIVLFLEIARDNGQLVDSYISYSKVRRTKISDFLAWANEELSRFFGDCEKARYLRESNLGVTVSALWGACKVIAQMPELRGTGTNANAALEYQADMIVDLFTRGLSYAMQEDGCEKQTRTEMPRPHLASGPC